MYVYVRTGCYDPNIMIILEANMIILNGIFKSSNFSLLILLTHI